MGFAAGGRFHILDVTANEVLTADVHIDTAMARPVPLKLVLQDGQPRLYFGRKYVTFTAQ